MKKIKEAYKESRKGVLVVYLLLRFLVILVMVRQIFLHNYWNAFLCILVLIQFLIPYFITKKLKIELPSIFEIIILLFIFSSEVLGEIQNFYGVFKHFDTVLHTLNGFLCAAVGFSLIDLCNNNSEKFNLSPLYLTIVAFCFSMTIGVLWEFLEYSIDKVMLSDMQKDKLVTKISSVWLNPDGKNKAIIVDNINKTIIYSDSGETVIEGGYLDLGLNDTMKDLIVNFVGAVVFSIFGYLYVINRDKYKIAEKFMPKKSK
ncbi:putative uncharacterized protein [Clostridium sp. CAG:524]|jgi:hypothetical protein|nr:putative uncharacterized protein [Clostridium sp. CAG:524]